MLSKDVLFVDIAPNQWRNLEIIFGWAKWEPATAFLLWSRGVVIGSWCEPEKRRLLLETDLADPPELAEHVFKTVPAIEKVCIYDLEALIDYCHKVHGYCDQLDSDYWFALCKHQLGQYEGIRSYFRIEPTAQLQPLLLLQAAEQQLRLSKQDRRYTWCLFIFDHRGLFFSLLATVVNGKIVQISTSEYLERFGLVTPTFNDFQHFKEKILSITGNNSEVIFVDRETVRDLVQSNLSPTSWTNAVKSGKLLSTTNALTEKVVFQYSKKLRFGEVISNP